MAEETEDKVRLERAHRAAEDLTEELNRIADASAVNGQILAPLLLSLSQLVEHTARIIARKQ